MMLIDVAHQENSKTFPAASVVQRLKAFAYDSLIILVYILILFVAFGSMHIFIGPLESLSPLFASPIILDGMAFVLLIFPVILYFTVCECSPAQATFGKRMAGLGVVNRKGGALTPLRACLRSTLKFLPWQLAHTCVYQSVAMRSSAAPSLLIGVGFVLVYVLAGSYLASAWLTKQRRTPYDWVSGAYVVNQQKSNNQLKIERKE